MTDQHGQHEEGRADLARSLFALRKEAGLTQGALGNLIGVSQTQVSRAEQDRRLLAPEKVAELAAACGAPTAEVERVTDLAKATAAQFQDARAILQSGAFAHQERVRRLEEDSALVRAFQPGIVLGQLQTADYARAVFNQRAGRAPREVERLVEQRMSKNAMLRDPARRWELIHTEGALTWGLGSREVMADQVRHIAEMSTFPHVRIGVVPAYRVADFTARHGWHLYDAEAVQIGVVSATALLSRAEDIRTYAELFTRVQSVAVFDDQARSLLARVEARYRGEGR